MQVRFDYLGFYRQTNFICGLSCHRLIKIFSQSVCQLQSIVYEKNPTI